MKETQERKPYEKPAVIFEKNLEALAATCGTGNPNVYTDGVDPTYCKGDGGACTGYLYS